MNKKLFLGMFAAAGMLLATSCSNDELDVVQSGNEAQVTFSLATEGGIATRAISDGTGADKLVYAVYKLDENGENPVLQNVVGSTNGQFVKTDFKSGDNVSITLAKGQTYQVAFWAQDGDCKAYDTDDLTAVKVNYKNEDATNAVNNDELRDAFFKMVEFEVAGNKTIDVVLKRPFAQINVGVDAEDWEAAVASGIEIEKSAVVVNNAANTINLLTGEVTGAETVEYVSAVIPDETLYVETDATKDGKEAYNWLSMSYILVADANDTDVDNDGTVGDERTTLESLQFTFYPENGNPIEFKEGLNSVPVQRNWRTNILGKILTGDIQFNITIDPVYDGDIIYPSKQEQELEFAATFGGTVTLSEDLTLAAPLNVAADMILNIADGKTLTGSINLAEGASLTVNGGKIVNTDNTVSGIISNGDLTLNNVEITSARHALRIESGNVVINGGTYTVNPTSKMTVHALNVGDGPTSVANVTIKGGTFIGPKGTTADSGAAVTVKEGSTVTIEGGDFSGGKNNTLSSKGTLTVKGGTFDQDPSAYVADGYTANKSEGSWYVFASDGNTAVVATSDALMFALNNGKTEIELTAGDFEFDWQYRNLLNGVTIIGNNSETSTLTFVGYGPGTWLLNGLTLKDVTVFERCQPENNTYSYYHSYFDVSGLNATNVVFKSGVQTANVASTFTKCTFISNYYWDYSTQDLSNEEMYGLVANGDVTIEGCAFTGFRGIDVSSACTVTINNSTFNVNNTEKPEINVKNNDAIVIVDGEVFLRSNATLNSVLANAAEGSTIVLSEDVSDYGTVTVGELKNVTIEGAENTTVRFVTSADSKIENVTVKNVDFNFVTGANQTEGAFVVINKDAEINNLVIEGCNIEGDNNKNSYGIFGQNPNASIVVKDCNFSNLGYAVQATAEGGYNSLSVENCKFENIISWAIMPQYGTYSGDLTITGCTFNECKGGLIKSGALQAGKTFTFTNNKITNSTGHDGNDAKWFDFNVSAGTTAISGNLKDNQAWTPNTANGLKTE